MSTNYRSSVELRAYIQMTYVAKFRSLLWQKEKYSYNPIHFSTFQNILKENKVIREENVRYVSKLYHEHHGVEMKYGHKELEKQSFVIIQKAFEMGLVNKGDLLISQEEWLNH